jgi:hydrogenase maturation protease
MHGDDGVGIHLLRALESQNREFTAECEARGINLRWIEGGTLGLELTHSLEGVEYLLVLDAVAMQQAPGTVARYEGDSLYQLPVGRSVHLMGLSDLLVAIRLLGDAPREVILLGVEPASTAWGLGMSAEVTAALPLLMGVAEKQILAWTDGSKRGGCSGSCACGSAAQCSTDREIQATLR